MCPACSRAAGRARAERWRFLRSPSPATRDARPPMTSSPIPAARSQFLLDLFAQVPDPRKRRGRRARAGRAAGRRDRGGGRGVAVVLRDRAVGRRRRAGGPGRAGRGPRTGGGVHVPARLRPGRPRQARPGSRCLAAHQGRADRWPAVIAVDGKTVRGARDKAGKAPHLVAALAHGVGRYSARSPWRRSRTRFLRCGTC